MHAALQNRALYLEQTVGVIADQNAINDDNPPPTGAYSADQTITSALRWNRIKVNPLQA